MLTSVGRAAARRVVGASRTLTTGPTAASAFIARPLAVRSFTSSRWSFMAVKASASTTKASPGRPKKPAATKAKKPKAAAKKKKPAKKPKKKVVAKKPKKKVAKVLTPEEAQRKKIKELKKTALVKEEPATRKPSAYNMYIKEKTMGVSNFKMDEVARGFANLSESEKQDYARRGEALHQENQKEHAAWQAGIPVEDIFLANLARNHLHRLTKKSLPKIEDERMPKKPASPFNNFVIENVRGASGKTLSDSAAQWKSLSDSEKARYAPDYAKQMEDHKTQLDVIRQMAKLKIRQSKKKVAAELETEIGQ